MVAATKSTAENEGGGWYQPTAGGGDLRGRLAAGDDH